MYEIPQQLQYKERIIFNLTFEQLIFAFIFLIPVLLILRSNLSLAFKVMISIVPLSFAVGFMYFDLFGLARMWYTWFTLRRFEHFQDIEDHLQIKKIENNILHVQNKKLALLQVDSLNFQIKPDKEKETISLAFQKLLNSLDFPIQILMTTETLDLNDYLRALKERIGDKSQNFFEEYSQNLEAIINKNEVTNRLFYLVVPEVTSLDIQLKICEERLHSLNLKTKRVGDNEIRRIFKELLEYKDEELLAPKKKKEKKKSLLQKVQNIWNEYKRLRHATFKIKNMPDYVELHGRFTRTISVSGYPRSVEIGFLDKIISMVGNFNVSLHIEPYSIENTFVMLNRELQKQRADLYAAKLKNQLNSSLEIQYADTLSTLKHLQKGDEKLYNISLYITCKADSKEDLDLLTKKVNSELNALLFVPKITTFRMIQGLTSCLPMLSNDLGVKRNVPTKALSAFFPFTSSFFTFDETGIWLGLNKNKIPIIRDVFKLSNANGICLASSGSGKSYTAKLFISRHLLNDTKVMVIDPQGEYRDLVKKYNGQRIDLSRDSKTIINPLDLMGHSYPEKRLTLMDLMPILIGDISDAQRSFIDKALTMAYEYRGIFMDDETSWHNEPPILEDLLEALKKLERDASSLEKVSVRSLINRLSIYVDGVFAFLNRQTKIDFSNKFICLDIGNLPKQVKPAMMFLVLDYIYTHMKGDLQRKLLVIDEAWSLLSKAKEASYIFEIVKTCRKFNLSLFLINQEVEDMLNSKAGRSVLANSSYTLLLRQKPAVIDNIQKVFQLSEHERNALLTALVGEGLLIMEDEHNHVKITASNEEHKIITTNADERLKVEKKKPQKIPKVKPQVFITVDVKERFFRKDEISVHEAKFLLKRHQYVEYTTKGITDKRKETYIIKPRSNESPQHFFLTYDIANYLKQFVDDVKTYQTTKPDIVFELSKKKYAIEVETGKVMKNTKKFRNKIQLLKKEYKNNWFFVVTDWNLASRYKKYGHTCDKRTIKGYLDKILKNS